MPTGVQTEWLDQYADKLKGYQNDQLVEEAVALAHQDWAKGRTARFAVINRIFRTLRDAINQIRSAFNGRQFHSPEDVFGAESRAIFEDIERGKIGARGPGGGKRSAGPAFQSNTDETDTVAFKRWFGDRN